MATITIEGVPENLVKRYGNKINYSHLSKLRNFVNQDNNIILYEAEQDELNEELINLSKKALLKDKSLFTNI
ncbi:MAG: hypothetical protein WC850_00795 [Candidatus Gracilibacteria bacterium]